MSGEPLRYTRLETASPDAQGILDRVEQAFPVVRPIDEIGRVQAPVPFGLYRDGCAVGEVIGLPVPVYTVAPEYMTLQPLTDPSNAPDSVLYQQAEQAKNTAVSVTFVMNDETGLPRLVVHDIRQSAPTEYRPIEVDHIQRLIACLGEDGDLTAPCQDPQPYGAVVLMEGFEGRINTEPEGYRVLIFTPTTVR